MLTIYNQECYCVLNFLVYMYGVWHILYRLEFVYTCAIVCAIVYVYMYIPVQCYVIPFQVLCNFGCTCTGDFLYLYRLDIINTLNCHYRLSSLCYLYNQHFNLFHKFNFRLYKVVLWHEFARKYWHAVTISLTKKISVY